MKKLLIALVTLIVIVLIYIQFWNLPEPIAANTTSGQRLAPGHNKVIRDEITFVDTGRATPASGDTPMSNSRTLKVSRWRPESSSKAQPLVIYSHGFMSSREDGTHLAEHLASRGYTLAAVDFPLTSYKATNHLSAGDVINQPGDLSFLIDQLLNENNEPSNPLFGTIDPQRIAALGYSLGGLTTLLIGYHPELSDPRVKIAVAIAAPSQMLTRHFFEYRKLPLLMIATPTDSMVDYPHNAAAMLQKNDESLLVTIGKGSHAGFNYLSRPLGFLKNPDQIGCWSLPFAGDVEGSSDWYQKLGTEAQGVKFGEEISACNMDPLPRTINPIRQQEITTLVTTAFLQCHFTFDEGLRAQHCNYLLRTAAAELREVSVELPQNSSREVFNSVSY